MKLINSKVTAIAAAVSLGVSASASAGQGNRIPYDVWAADQSNSVTGMTSRGVNGSYVWVWNSEDVEKQLNNGKDALPLKCDGTNRVNKAGTGCDIWDIFPRGLNEIGTGETLGTLSPESAPNFGKLHGMLPDPQNRYMNVNMFAPGGGYVGIMDGATKEAVALFRVTSSGTGNTMHMTFWNSTGDAIYIANLGGRVLERIDIERDDDGTITNAIFRRDASLFIGKAPAVVKHATAFSSTGGVQDGYGRTLNLVGEVSAADYSAAALSKLTPAGYCKENGCIPNVGDLPGENDAPNGGRPNTVIVCPIASDDGNIYITVGGGGLLVADGTTEPMNIVAEYEQEIFNGAGCGGIQVGNNIWLNAGASAGEASTTDPTKKGGSEQSTFTMYTIDDSMIGDGPYMRNSPAPNEVYKDTDDTDGNGANTTTIGNTECAAGIGQCTSNTTGQLPGVSTRRDAHGMARTVDGAYIHNVDRIQNIVEVFDTANQTRIGTYDLTSGNGRGNGKGACADKSVTDDAGLPGNDPAPDLMGMDPNGNYLVFAARGPAPVSVTHAAQGSCPGVGIIKLDKGGSTGQLAGVLRTTNPVDTAPVSATGGHMYTGAERSDPHGASIRTRVEDIK